MTEDAYVPIDCDLHDRLEDVAVRQVRQRLLLRGEDGGRIELNARVADLFARDGAEFVRLEDGTVIRLDRVLAVGDSDGGG